MLDLLNLYCHGYVATPIIEAFRRHGLFELLGTGSFRRRDWLIRKVRANAGYLTAALHALESLGWLEKDADAYRATDRADSDRFDLDLTALYAVEPRQLLLEEGQARQFGEKLEEILRRNDETDSLSATLAYGAIVLPLVMALQQQGAAPFGRKLQRLDARLAAAIRALFVRQQWLADDDGPLTATGEHILGTHVFTIALSYRPMLHAMEELLFGDHARVYRRSDAGEETHVDRRLNVIASGLQHAGYFHDIRQKVIDIFSREPLELQPQAVVDVGCGDGSLLEQVHRAIREQSLRGPHLERLPVRLVGVDYNRQALEETARTLSCIEHHTLLGDINRPDELREALEGIGVTREQRVLHIRSFLDHNISVDASQPVNEALAVLAADQPGGYLDESGGLLDTVAVLSRWQQHLRNWAECAHDSELLILEAHALPAPLVQRQLAASENFYFDTIHNLSHQYLISAEAFVTLAASVGLFNDGPLRRYPKLAGFCRISMHHLRRRDYVVRHATAADLPSLYRLERLCWPRPMQASQRQIRARLRQYPQGQFVLEKDGEILGATYSQRIAGTDALRRCNAGNVEELHQPSGPIVQLLGLNVDPAVQDLGYGDQLLELVLQRCSVMTGVTQVAGVTVCRNYDAGGPVPLQDYIRQRGSGQDPVLAFHEAHGAAIVEALPGYRPRDRANRGHGVLIVYDVHDRVATAVSAIPARSDEEEGEVRGFVEGATMLLLGAGQSAFDADRPLMEMGLDSADLLALQRQLEQRFQRALKPGFFFEYSTVDKVIAYLTARPASVAAPARRPSPQAAPADIAVIGMACRLPGGIETPDELWQVLAEERCVVGSYPRRRGGWPSGADLAGIDQGGFLHDAEAFDHAFFRMSPREAQMTDPQQRILLELAWACLENAAVPPATLKGTGTGVFIGASNSDYSRLIQDAGLEIEAHYATGSALAALANRISYFLDLSGPSLLIDTACSSSLVALHAAMRSLRGGECPAALVGGINLICHPHLSVAYRKAGMLSPDGRCRTFDAAASGYVRAEGAVMLLLKPLSRAIADGDPIHAVLKGSAVNHGGLAAGLTVPNPQKQSELLLAAWKDAGIAPQELSYIEAHGTGTSLGDPIEIEGIQTAYGHSSGACAIGSLKSNLGHLEPAAGIAGLLKVIVALQRRQIPASIHFETLNPRIHFNGSRLSIAARPQPWEGREPRLAGVSSFGSGGANAHVVVQEFSECGGKAAAFQGTAIIPLSARTTEQLRRRAEDLLRHIQRSEPIDLGALSHTLQAGREAMKERVSFVVRSIEELAGKLETYLESGRASDSETLPDARVGASDKPRRISLPTYPFARERHWIERAGAASAKLHPLLHASMSPLLVQRDTAGLTGGERKLLSLPTYPFSQERHWIERVATRTLHPLLHEKVSGPEDDAAVLPGKAPRVLVLPTYPFARQRHWIEEASSQQPLLYEEYWREEPLVGELPPADSAAIVFAERGRGEAGIHALFDLFKTVRERRPRVAQVTLVGQYDDPWDAAWIGFERSLGLLLPETQISVLYTRAATPRQLADAARHGGVIRYDGERRFVLSVRPVVSRPSQEIPFRQGGGYLITGGCGALGLRLARHLAQRYEARLLLTGRRPLSDEMRQQLEALKARYEAVDVSDPEAMRAWARSLPFELNGVVHAAGVEPHKPFFEQSRSEIESVLRPKTIGTVLLDEVLAEQPLDFVCYFSSSAAVLGDFGACAYAVANRFQMAYGLQRRGRGKTVVINWPLWRDGAMGKGLEQDALDTETGIRLWSELVRSGRPQTLVMMGKPERVEQRAPTRTILSDLRSLVSRSLRIAPEQLSDTTNLVDYGFDSLQLTEFARKLTSHFGLQVSPAVFFKAPTIAQLSEYLQRENVAPVVVERAKDNVAPIAIIGMSGRFPGARTVDELWTLLAEGKSAIQEIPATRWNWREYSDRIRTNRGGFIEGIEEFDPLFFQISPREAEQMDPGERLLLMEAYRAIEDAGVAPSSLGGSRTGVFVGMEESHYELITGRRGVTTSGNAMISSRLSYFLDLRGPAMATNTACSSGLVALHQAVTSLRLGECDAALVAGVSLSLAPESYMAMSEAGMLSPDGQCHSFARDANGIGVGEAVVVLMLKPLPAAIAAGDRIHGVVRASGINFDGRTNGVTAPSGRMQAELIESIYSREGIDAGAIGHVVTHGTGTPLGDPVEIDALNTAFRNLGDVRSRRCAITSCKSNVGHTMAASGLVSVVSLLKGMEYHAIPASLHCEEESEHIAWADTPFYVNKTTRAWEGPHLGAVSAFGRSGTNAHVVIEEVRSPAAAPAPQGRVIVPLSARTQEQLVQKARELLEFVRKPTGTLAEIAYTLQVGRDAMARRAAFIAGSLDELAEKLEAYLRGEESIGDDEGASPWGEIKPRRIGLPGYPFARERYWIDTRTESRAAVLHPLLHAMSSKPEPAGGNALVAGRRRLLSLPTYPFSRERHWVERADLSPGRLHPLLHASASALVVQDESLSRVEGLRLLSLPTYPFARERHWIERAVSAAVLHPLLHEKVSEPEDDAAAVLGGKAPRVLALPTYPFARKRHWIEEASQPQPQPLLYEEYWREEPLVGELPPADSAAIVFAERGRGEAGIHALFDLFKSILEGRRRVAQVTLVGQYGDPWDAAWIGFERSLGLLLPETQISVLYTDRSTPRQLADAARHGGVIRYDGERRLVLSARPVVSRPSQEIPFRQGGGYLITGGCGALGLRLARHLAQRYEARLLLTGRRPLSDEMRQQLEALKARYEAVDVSDPEAMRAWARSLPFELNGVIHAAGVEPHKPFFEQTPSEIEAVLHPKTIGTVLLDEVLAEQPLDFVCYFSSSAAVLGDFGACAYAVANRFQMAYGLQRRGRGKTVVINWPLWRDGAMGKGLEQDALDTETGIRLWSELVRSGRSQTLVMVGKPERVEQVLQRAYRSTPPAAPPSILADLRGLVSKSLRIAPQELSDTTNLVDYGFDSLQLTQFAKTLTAHFGVEITPVVFFKAPTIAQLSEYLERENVPVVIQERPSDNTTPAIAIVGMSGRFPGARTVDELWTLLAEGKSAIQEIPPTRWNWREYSDRIKTNRGGFIEGIEEFDPLFFEISPREAEQMDPGERLLLMEAYRAIEDAGVSPSSLRGSRTGVFVGMEESHYELITGRRGVTTSGNAMISSRLSYFLDLRGPAMATNTACSSGLVALHQAVTSLRLGECDAALVAGVSLSLAPESYMVMSEAGMLSPDGQCRSFARNANGIGVGEAVVVLMLKPLPAAIAAGDRIHGVVKASGINFDGRTNGVTAPNGRMQAELIESIYSREGIDAAAIGHVVTHGTGTPLGDPVEIDALNTAFRKLGVRSGRCALTSCKSNVGHTMAASGLVSVVSLLKGMEHHAIPASLHCEEETEHIAWADTPFYVNKTTRAWEQPHLGAVSAFGRSGTNAHVVIEEYRSPAAEPAPQTRVLVPLSARTREQLQEKARELLAFLRTTPHTLAEIAYTLQVGRDAMAERVSFTAGSMEELAEKLEAYLRGEEPIGGDTDFNEVPTKPRRISLPGYPFARQRYWIDPPAAEQPQQPAPADDGGVLEMLRHLLARTLKLSPAEIDEHEPLSAYGIDSLSINEMNAELAKVYPDISRTLFFEYRTLSELAAYFLREHPSPARRVPRAEGRQEPIAIIGISGMYPQAATLEQYWENLRSGRNCIGEIPPDRWPLDGFYEPDPQEAIDQGKSYSKWGGFLDRFAEFDALFFGIAPRDALNMDPQERLFLQAAWQALENAGYTRRDLRTRYGQKVGVFAGITRPGYSLYGTLAALRDAKFFPNTSFSSVANRLSYFLDLTGPSMPIDTMCSSSLTAIHEACEHIHRGECRLAFAGGVNLNLHPSSYIALCAQHMLSADGLCRSFGAGGNGFVPGEGVGVVLLKPLSAAIEDDDVIHGVILATSVNHGGRTNGYTVPNPQAQAELIRQALDKAGVHARHLSYIEAHGTGTSLGDPIEITGLQQAFGADTKDTGFCRLGSAKSNIGHLDSAAGIAGLTKVLLQMKHRQIAPSLNAVETNPNIDLGRTPFALNRTLTEWERPVVDGEACPRIAGVSSFGAGGANAHVVVQEYPAPERTEIPVSSVIVPLSARTEEQLRQRAADLLELLRSNDPDVTLARIAYTLQVGREAMERRLAFVVDSIEQLTDKLQAFLAGERELEHPWPADWEKLWDENKPKRIPLPGYPFARDRYWIDSLKPPPERQGSSSTLTGDELFLRDHRVGGRKVLPAVAYLEMIRAALPRRSAAVELRNTVWAQPIVVSAPTQVSISLVPDGKGQIDYEMRTDAVHCQGQAVFHEDPRPARLDVAGLAARMQHGALDPDRVYAAFARMGLDYGPSLRGIASIRKGERELLAELRLPPAAEASWGDYGLHPALLDSALQSTIGLNGDLHALSGPFLPFALTSLRVLAPCEKEMLAWVRPTSGGKVDIDLCDGQGNVCVELRELSTRPLPGEDAFLAVPVWQPAAAVPSTSEPAERHVITCDLPQLDLAERYSHYALACFELLRELLEQKSTARVLVQVVAADEIFAGLAGLLKTAALENPRLAGQVILTDSQITAEQLDENRTAADSVIRYQNGTRQVLGWQEVRAERAPIGFKEGGVYLITGGLGGLGILFAREILQQAAGSRVILAGRSALTPAGEAILSSLPGAVEYRQADVCDPAQVGRLMTGRLDGILHCAGILRDSFLLKKTAEDFSRVLAPKVTGTFNLDQASRDMDLDFLVLFSSLAAAEGNPGQADYAAANGFMDWFARDRNEQVAAGQRKGKTLSINWPLWKEGGMSIDRASLERLQEATGIRPLETANGMRAFHQSLASEHDRVLVAQGDAAKLRARTHGTVEERSLEDYLKEQLSAELSLPAARIDPRAPFERYGIDSIRAMNLTNRLEKTFGSLPKTLFFEYQTIQELSAHLRATYPDGAAGFSPPKVDGGLKPAAPRERPTATTAEPIAIIGLSGRYPEAADVASYWQNLRDGRNCIVEIPTDRWDWREYYSDDHSSKWGGFIPGVDEFDPRFFNIPPSEAPFMDPQERLFLQHAWMAVEDAGYTRERLQIPHAFGLAGQVGVYVGVMYTEYQLFGAEESMRGRRMAFAGNPSNIANRVSYALNVHGPSMAVDTMCSSSLTAIHLACQDLKQGRTDLAVAGGVNVTIHPNKYLMLSAGRFISGESECRSFGEGGEGYIPGEGVGAVVLKRLSEAERDGDHIYGVIRGSALNHGGRTNRYTVPNPVAQAGAISVALAEANVHARQVSYIEAHGTGTKLGDPIEIAALSKAFQRDTSETGFCLIGSAKSNIGHCESAAGIAGLTKVLLQMQHGQIAPSLHAAPPSPYIEFEKTPFVVNHSLRDWEAQPRIAGVSSFGAGGSNAHLVVEEYEAPAMVASSSRVAVPLSARTSGQLEQKARDLLAFLRDGTELDLGAIAYTLQTGREAMEERLGILASTVEELSGKLEAWIAGDAVDGIYQATGSGDVAALFDQDDLQQIVARWIEEKKLAKLLELWVRGHDLDWSALHGAARPRRVSLPVYPFARERYWVGVEAEPIAQPAPTRRVSAPSAPPSTPAEKMELFLRQELARKLQRPVEEIAPDQSFFEAGLTSLDVTDLIEKTSQLLKENVSPAAAFEHPDVRRFAAYLAATYRIEIEPRIPAIVPIDRSAFERLPLSFAQERLWFINQLEPDSAIYNIAGAVDIKGRLDVDKLERALNLVISRHDNLRTVFPIDDGKARQRILDRLDFRLERIEADRDSARQLCQTEAATPFDLAAGPLIRGRIIRLAPEEHVLMLNMHHIISDAWSMAVLTKELSLIMDGRSAELPSLPIQYVDYSVWQRKWLEESGALERQLAYWQEKLAGAPDALDLETDYPRPAVLRYAGAVEPFTLSPELTRQLKSLARQQDCSLNAVLLAAFKVMLYRYSGQEDHCIGSPIANRQYGGTAALIGMFANTVVLRSRVDPAMPFSRYLAELKKTTTEVHAHQDAPFDKVIDRLGVKRETNRNPLIQHAFVQQQNPDYGTYDGQRIEPFAFDRRIAVFDQVVEVFDRKDDIAGTWTYSTELYRRDRIQAFIAAYERVLTAVAEEPSRRISECGGKAAAFQSGSSAAALQNEVLVEQVWDANGELTELAYTQADIGDHRIETHLQSHLNSRRERLYHLVEIGARPRTTYSTSMATVSARQTASAEHDGPPAYVSGGPLVYPENTPATITEAMLRAAEAESKGLTVIDEKGGESFLGYRQLLDIGTRVTGGLQQRGLAPGTAVILQCPNLADYYTAFWGCLLGGYIPVTVAIPPVYATENAVVQKLAAVWQLLDAPLVISNRSNRASLAALDSNGVMPGMQLVDVESLQGSEPSRQLHVPSPGDVAFYQLSSGSTGISKCIQITHKGVIAHCTSVREFEGHGEDDVCLNWMPVDHVAAVLTAHLKSVYLRCQDIQVKTEYIMGEPLNLLRLLSRYRVTWAFSPNFGYKLVSEALKKDDGSSRYDLSSLRHFINGGEQVNKGVLEEFIRKTAPYGFDSRAMQPAFGMAESCTGIAYNKAFTLETSYHSVGGTEFIGLGTVIPGVEIRIADADGNLLREEQIGRMQLRGPVITPGYYRDADATAAAFTDDGWFNSGDLGFLYRGQLYITGREKEMIIVRGANIYCHEIEALAGDVATVEPGHVGVFPISKGPDGAEGYGLAYVGDSSVETIREIKRVVTERLGVDPDAIIPLEKHAFPRTTSGKIQRSQLARQLVRGDYERQLQQVDLEEANDHTLPDWFYEGIWSPAPVHIPDDQLPPLNLIVIGDEELRQRKLLPRERVVLVDRRTGNADPAGSLAILRTLMEPAYRDLTVTWIGIHEGRDSGLVHAESALLRSFAQERAHTHVVLCDADDRTPWRQILAIEVRAGLDQNRDVRYRGGERSVYRLQHVLFERPTESHAPGLSLVLGGLGGIGRAVCELLLRRGNQRVIVTGRSEPALRQVAWRELEGIAEATAGQVIYLEHDLIHDPPDELCQQIRDIEQDSGLVLSTIVQATASEVAEGPIEAHQPRDYAKAIHENDRITRALEALGRGRPYVHVLEIGSVNGTFGGFHFSTYAYRKGHELGRHERLAALGILYTNVQQTMWAGVGLSAGRKNLGAGRGYMSISRTQGMQSLAMLMDRRKPGLYFVGLDGRHRDVHEQLTMSSRRRLVTPDHCIPALEERLAPLIAHVTLEDEHGCVVDQYRPGRVTIRGQQKTSLIGRYDFDGCIDLESAGVRHSGYQIDLAAIEAVIRRHDAVRDCRVLHRWEENGREQLIAFVVAPDARDVEASVRRQLPFYMQPGRFVVVEEIPLTRGGLLDRAALERMAVDPESTQTRVAPRNDVERRLAAIWAQVLEVDPTRIGVEDNFFELGGNSLLATQLVSRIRGQFAVDLQVKDLFDRSTVAGIAGVMNADVELEEVTL